jgi:hypothetical protein
LSLTNERTKGTEATGGLFRTIERPLNREFQAVFIINYKTAYTAHKSNKVHQPIYISLPFTIYSSETNTKQHLAMRIDSLLNDSPSGSLSPTNIPQRSYSTSDGYSQQYPTHLDPAFTYQHQHQYRRPSLQTPVSHHHHGHSASAGVSFEHVQSTPQFTSPIWYAPTGTTKPSQTQRQMLPALSNITNHQQSSSYQSHHSHSQQNSPRSGARNEHVFNEHHYGGSYQRGSFDETTDRLMGFAHVATQIDSRSRDTRGSVGIIE